MIKEHELNDYKLQLANAQELATTHKQLAQRYKSELDILASTVQSQDEDKKEVAAALRASEVKVTEELKKTRAEVERLQQLLQTTEERLQRERAAAATNKAAMQARITELKGALAQKEKSPATDAAALQSAIEEHKDSDEYQTKLKEVGLYGFNLLKKVLIREKKLSSAELNAYDFGDCILEEDDEIASP